MLAKKVKYTDFDGNEREETFYFNLSKTELMRLQVSADGGLVARITKMLERQDSKEILDTFEWLILTSYGEKSDDGRKFEKVRDGHKLAEDFKQTNAYEVLFSEVTSDTQHAIDFFNGVIDPSVMKEINAAQKDTNVVPIPTK